MKGLQELRERLANLQAQPSSHERLPFKQSVSPRL